MTNEFAYCKGVGLDVADTKQDNKRNESLIQRHLTESKLFDMYNKIL